MKFIVIVVVAIVFRENFDYYMRVLVTGHYNTYAEHPCLLNL